MPLPQFCLAPLQPHPSLVGLAGTFPREVFGHHAARHIATFPTHRSGSRRINLTTWPDHLQIRAPTASSQDGADAIRLFCHNVVRCTNCGHTSPGLATTSAINGSFEPVSCGVCAILTLPTEESPITRTRVVSCTHTRACPNAFLPWYAAKMALTMSAYSRRCPPSLGLVHPTLSACPRPSTAMPRPARRHTSWSSAKVSSRTHWKTSGLKEHPWRSPTPCRMEFVRHSACRKMSFGGRVQCYMGTLCFPRNTAR